MRLLPTLFAVILVSLFSLSAAFSVAPYLYSTEANATIGYINFTTANGSSAQIVTINGGDSFLVLNGNLVSDPAVINSVLTGYYTSSYPSASELSGLEADMIAFNSSRNYMTQYGPSEQICKSEGTFLVYKPCNDITSCTVTATLYCQNTGAQGCETDVLATDILGYVQDLAALDSAVASFQSAYSSMSPATANTSLQQMDSALSAMQAAAQNESGSNLMMGNPNTCPDCLGVCPNTNFNYSAITAAQGEISDLDTKIASFSLLSTTVSAIEYSTQQRMAYQQGEAQSAIYAPQYQAAEAKYGYLKGQAVQTLLIVADPNYVSSASAFLNKSDAIEAEISTRNFTDFESLLSGYENAGTALSALNVNATVAYNGTLAAQDKADDAILEAQWQVNGLSKDSVNSYNSLVAAKANLDGLFDPPMTTAQYLALSAKYQNLTSSADAFIASSSGYEGTYGRKRRVSRTAVDGVMVIIKGLMPTSFETRQLVGERDSADGGPR